MVDTSVLIAGIAGFKTRYAPGRNDAADFLYRWVEHGSFLWLVTEDILEEYREVATRKGVRSHVIGRLLNLLREEAEEVWPHSRTQLSPDPKDNAFCLCAQDGEADFIVTLNTKDFPLKKLAAKVLTPRQFGRKPGAKPKT